MRAGLLCIVLLMASHSVSSPIPHQAIYYQRDLIRISHAHWGLDAPIALFAAQIQQESSWRKEAKSYASAQGLAQFMPTTAAWMAELHQELLGQNQPYNPIWAMQALVLYNKWHYQRISAATDCDRWAFTLSAYNGGLGWVQRDRKKARLHGIDAGYYWGAVELINSGRSQANFKQNRDYPQRIIFYWQPLYVAAHWGAGVCH